MFYYVYKKIITLNQDLNNMYLLSLLLLHVGKETINIIKHSEERDELKNNQNLINFFHGVISSSCLF